MTRGISLTVAAAVTVLHTMFTVPSGERYVVTHIRTQSTNNTSTTVTLAGVGGVYASTTVFDERTLAGRPLAGDNYDYVGRTAFEAGDVLQASATGSGANVVVDFERVILGV